MILRIGKKLSIIVVIVIVILILDAIIIHTSSLSLTTSNVMVISDINRNINSNVRRTIEYGTLLKSGRVPLVMLKSTLDNDVLEHFLQIPMFSCEESDLHSFKGLENRVKMPIYIYEGYYHSLPTASNVYSRNPNPKIAIGTITITTTIIYYYYYYYYCFCYCCCYHY